MDDEDFRALIEALARQLREVGAGISPTSAIISIPTARAARHAFSDRKSTWSKCFQRLKGIWRRGIGRPIAPRSLA